MSTVMSPSLPDFSLISNLFSSIKSIWIPGPPGPPLSLFCPSPPPPPVPATTFESAGLNTRLSLSNHSELLVPEPDAELDVKKEDEVKDEFEDEFTDNRPPLVAAGGEDA